MNRSVLYTLCAVLTIAAIILVGCQKSAVTGNTVVDTNVPTETPASPEETDVLSEEQTVEEFPSEEITDTKSSNEPTYDGDVKVFTIKANNMRFEPYTMTVKKGDKVYAVIVRRCSISLNCITRHTIVIHGRFQANTIISTGPICLYSIACNRITGNYVEINTIVVRCGPSRSDIVVHHRIVVR